MIPDVAFHEGEEYRKIQSHPGIFISAKGKMITFRLGGPVPKIGIMHRTPRIMNGSPDQDGYLFITYPKKLVHALCITAWQGPRPDGLEIRHLDGNKLNNASANLAYGTSRENGKDKAVHGSCKGTRNGAARMTEETVLAIRADGVDMPKRALYVKYSMFSEFAVWAALTGYTWAHLPNAMIGNRKCSKEGWKSGVRINAKTA